MTPRQLAIERTGRPLPVLGFAVLACALAFAPGCEPPPGVPGSDPDPDRETGGYAGAAACAACHPDEASAWRGSHHDLAMQPATPETVLGDFSGASLSSYGVRTTFSSDGERLVVRTEGPDGVLHDYDVAFAFGVEPLQQVLVELPRGRLQAPTVAWDARPAAEGGQRWYSLQPDEPVPPGDPLHWSGLAYNWNHQCAECHSTGVRKGYQPDGDRFETRFREVDVACEACHGPGAAHVAWAQSDGARGSRALPVPFPGPGTWRRAPDQPIAQRTGGRAEPVEVETCGRCHSRRTTIHEADPEGRPLLDTHRVALLEEGLYHVDGQLRDEVYVYGSFLQSRMYAAGVTCSDCHDPHSLALRAEGNALCGRCHDPETFDDEGHHHHAEGSPGARCAACHMPERTYMGIDRRSEHAFRVPRPDLSPTLGTPSTCTDCHADRSPGWAADAAAAWWPDLTARTHFATALHAGREGALAARDRLRSLVSSPEQPAIARATALGLLAAYAGPELASVLADAARDPDPLVRMAAADAAEALPPPGRLAVAARLLDDPVRSVRIAAASVLAPVPAELWPRAERVALERALEEYRVAQRLNADRPEARLNLANLHAALGEPEAAAAELEAALRRAPWAVPAIANWADLLRAQGNDTEGERVLRAGLARAPGSAELHHALGLLLVRTGRMDRALSELRTAAELAPDQTRFAYVYAVALDSTGDPDAALDVLEAAHARRPGEPGLRTATVAMALEQGKPERARALVASLREQAPDDPELRELARQIEAAASPTPPVPEP